MLRLLKQSSLLRRIPSPISTVSASNPTSPSFASHFASAARKKDAFAACGALKRLTSSKGKTAGRNSSGRITSFHRGGGAKRLQRKIDLKRRTASTGVVERIEYDPNRSSRIALVRWTEGVKLLRRQRDGVVREDAAPPPPEIAGSTKVTSESIFSFSSLPGKVNQAKLPGLQGKNSLTQYVSVGLPESNKTTNEKAPPVSFNSTLDLPWIAVAGAKPAFFAPKLRENNSKSEENTFSLSEIQRWKNPKPKRKGAISWHCDFNKEPSGLLVASGQEKSTANIIPTQVAANALSKPRPSDPNNLSKTFQKSLIPVESYQPNLAPVSYILASNQCSVGSTVMNCDFSKPSKTLSTPKPFANYRFQDSPQTTPTHPPSYNYDMLDLNSTVGNCIKLSDIRMGTWIHDIEIHPGQGAKLARGAGSFAKIIKEPTSQHCLIRLPSGVEKLIDARCRATIGIGSNVSHRAKKLTKAGHKRWLGRRPVVRGVAMNPVDHPHGGGEGRTKGGRPSVSPWGKPTKAGFKSASVKKAKMMVK
ncbi:hypothetical protein LUZ60_013218 [Juncus effusus]|nr:hypothetical protein LUZ60_013218 [Juncus effusus]